MSSVVPRRPFSTLTCVMLYFHTGEGTYCNCCCSLCKVQELPPSRSYCKLLTPLHVVDSCCQVQLSRSRRPCQFNKHEVERQCRSLNTLLILFFSVIVLHRAQHIRATSSLSCSTCRARRVAWTFPHRAKGASSDRCEASNVQLRHLASSQYPTHLSTPDADVGIAT